MKKRNTYISIVTTALFLVLTYSSFGQSTNSVKETAAAAATSNPQTVNAQQSGAWNVGIDAARNGVRVTNSDSDPVTVKLTGAGSGRKPYQARFSAEVPAGSISGDSFIAIPAGKRLVIENISAIARTGAGSRMQIQLYSYFDNGDGVGDVGDITFHRIALTDQGTYAGVATSSANHKVLIFADEQIGTAHFGIALQVRMDTPAVGGTNQGQVTLSGYLEDLPTP